MIPVSAQFDIIDWNPRAAYAADGSEVIGGANGFVTNAVVIGTGVDNNEYSAVFALGKNAGSGTTRTTIRLPIEMTAAAYTFEMELALATDTPDGISDPEHRIFISANKFGARGAGFLITRKGLYLAASATDSAPSHLSGTDKFFWDEQGSPQRVVIRALVDNASNRLALYVGLSGAVYDPTNGAQWWTSPSISLQHNVAARADSDAADGIVVVLTAPAGLDSTLALYGLRVASSLLSPVVRPQAVINAPWQLPVTQATVLSGSGSYDKYGAPITHDWTIEHKPATSNAKLQGATKATAYTAVGAATAGDLVFTYNKYTSAGNLWTIVVVYPTVASSPLSLSITGNTLYISIATDAMQTPITPATGVLLALSSDASYAYSPEIAALFSAELAAPLLAGTDVPPAGTYSFSGGTGSSLSAPLFVPDVIGPYVISLRVSNGVTTSTKELVTVSVTATNEVYGEVPDSEYIFKYLPDFWKLVQGREQLAVAWGAINQVLTSDLVQAWQNDYAKSIRDIGREYQRRWIHFTNKLDISTNHLSNFTSAAGDIDDVLVSTTLASTGYTSKYATVPAGYAKAPVSTGPVLYRATDFPPRILYVASVAASGAEWTVASATSEFSTCHKVTGGSALRETATVNGVADPAHNFRYETKIGDYLRASTPLQQHVQEVIASYANEGAEAILAADLGISVWDRLTWEVVRPVAYQRLTRQPYFVCASGLLTMDIAFGDVAMVGFLSPYTSAELLIPCTVLAVSDTLLFVDLQPVLQALTLESQLTETATVWQYAQLSQVAPEVKYLLRANRTAVTKDLVRVPVLGTATIDAEFLSGRDYSVTEERLQFVDTATGTATTVAGTPDLSISVGSTWYSLPTELAYDALKELGASTVLLPTGVNAGLHTVLGSFGNTLSLDRVLIGNETTTFRMPRYSALSAPPLRHWAEVAFFDNWSNIEGSFGLMVGLPKQYLTDAAVETDYLSVVRALCFTFMSGPTLGNLALLSDAFIGVPFLEHAGQVVSIVEPSSDGDGHIVVHDVFGRDVHYRYPLYAELAENPTTQRVISAHALVQDPAKLAGEDRSTYDDSVLPANSRLFTATKVDDYISDPGLVASVLKGADILTKYHTFIVRVPLDVAKTTSALPLIRTYLNEAKAAYTRFILYGTMLFTDDISVEDSLDITYTLLLKDTLHSMPVSLNPAAALSTAGVSNVYPSLVLADDYASSKSFLDGAYTTLVDATERYESGYQEGVLDDYSGDGSMNSVHQEYDAVNQMDFDDIDVCSSLLWMPITKSNAGVLASRSFTVGEEVFLTDAGGNILPDDNNYLWISSPPVIVHIGCGEHLKTPYAYDPQYMHPYTYLILGFHRPATIAGLTDPLQVLNNYGTERRLDGWFWADQAVGGAPLLVQGATSGAVAALGTAPDRLGVPADRRLFNVVRVNQLDKLNEYNLKDEAVVQQSVYIPLASAVPPQVGRRLSDLASAFGSANLAAREAQVQMAPYDTSIPDNKQLMPALAAGVYTNWAGAVPGDLFQFDYADVGPLSISPTAINAFTKNPANTDVQNLHIGTKHTRAGGWHYTHGFVTYAIPAPVAKLATDNLGLVRIEGNYFIDKDVTATVVTAYTDTPSDYDGLYSGSWVFARSGGNTFYAANVTFVQGLVPATTVLGLSGAVQTATGHVLVADFTALAAGTYDIIVRHYYPYERYPGSGRRVHTTESIIPDVQVVP
jgi:hypothetical protein